MHGKKLCETNVLSNTAISKEIYSINLNTPEIAKAVKPGQFAMVYLDKGEMLLPRPISFCDANPETGIVTLVYQIVGAGTQAMSELQKGDKLKILAPLGNGFYQPNGKKIALVGGGIGTPPLLLMAKKLTENGIKPDIFLGFRSDPILIEEFQPVAEKLFIATEDGSFGHSGRILDVLEAQKSYDEILSCGPTPMLRALKSYAAEKQVPTQISLEEYMGCGIGTCVGCVVKIKGTYTRICCEGTVFYSNEVDF